VVSRLRSDFKLDVPNDFEMIQTQMQRNELVLSYRQPMHDERIPGAGPNVRPLTTQREWVAAVAELPWSPQQRTVRVLAFLRVLLHPASPPACHQQGAQVSYCIQADPATRPT
jgi:hypothetical protein